MKKKAEKPRNEYAAFERALKESKERQYLLRLYVTGATPKSVLAINNIRRICEENLKGRYRLEVVDVYRQPELVKGQDLIAVPTLIKFLPEPLRKFIGDMMDTKRILVGLDLRLREDGKDGSP
jgi:circadian clock protein KaiB